MPTLSRADWLCSARDVLAQWYGPQGGVTVSISNDRCQSITLTLPADAAPPPAAMSPIEAEMVRALAVEPMIGKRLASRLGMAYSSHFRSILGNLVERGVLTRGPDGYRTADTHPTG